MRACELLISVVSHQDGALVKKLLGDLTQDGWRGAVDFEVVITLNVPEDEAWLDASFPFPIHIIRNDKPRGFGANHNSAFRLMNSKAFAVVNPDIRLGQFHLSSLWDCLDRSNAGVCGPLVLDTSNKVEDSARRFPTLRSLFSRVISGGGEADYNAGRSPLQVDWVGGMFLLFKSAAFKKIAGFDERYFMYMEDVEICRFLHSHGYDVFWVTETSVIHDAQRASHFNARHLGWHLTSVLRYLFSRGRTP